MSVGSWITCRLVALWPEDVEITEETEDNVIIDNVSR